MASASARRGRGQPWRVSCSEPSRPLRRGGGKGYSALPSSLRSYPFHLHRVRGASFPSEPTSVSLDASVPSTPSVAGRESHAVQAPRSRPRPFPHTALPPSCSCCSWTGGPLLGAQDAFLFPFSLSRASFRLRGWHDVFFYTFCVAVCPPPHYSFLKHHRPVSLGISKRSEGVGCYICTDTWPPL